MGGAAETFGSTAQRYVAPTSTLRDAHVVSIVSTATGWRGYYNGELSHRRPGKYRLSPVERAGVPTIGAGDGAGYSYFRYTGRVSVS